MDRFFLYTRNKFSPQCFRCHQIDFESQQVFKIELQTHIAIERSRSAEIHQKIKITYGFAIATCY